MGPESREPNPEDAVTGPQLGAFDGVLVDGHLPPQGEVFGGQVEPGYQERSDEKKDRLEDAHGVDYSRERRLPHPDFEVPCQIPPIRDKIG
jgi:hypothetical protein